MRPSGVVPIGTGALFVSVSPGDVVSVYVNGDATFGWQTGNGTALTWRTVTAAGLDTSAPRVGVPDGVSSLVITPTPGPSVATLAAVAFEQAPC